MPGKNKVNVYSYTRSYMGYGNECNLIAVPLQYKAGLTSLLTFIDVVNRKKHSLSKDMIFLFYEDSNYSLAVKEFLDAYYHMEDDKFKNDGSLFFEE